MADRPIAEKRSATPQRLHRYGGLGRFIRRCDRIAALADRHPELAGAAGVIDAARVGRSTDLVVLARAIDDVLALNPDQTECADLTIDYSNAPSPGC